MKKFILPVLLLGLVALTPLKVMAKPDPIFNSAIHKIAKLEPLKNAKLGKITYLSFSTKPNPKLRKAFGQIENFEKDRPYYQQSGDYSYGYINFDLNSDGIKDAIITFNRSFASGSGGQHYWIFQGTKNGYRLIGTVMHVTDILITSTKTKGWNNLIRVPGKLFMWEEAYYESYRFNGKEYKLYGNLKQGVTLSGYVISHPNPNVDDPKFDHKFWHPL